MAKKNTYSKLGLKVKIADPVVIKIGESDIEVNQYLPMEDKADLISWVVDNAIDDITGRFSPIRLDTYFYIAIAKWYGNISFTDKQMESPAKIYDTLVTNDIILNILGAIPEEEYNYLEELLEDTVEDIADYNSSFAGIVRSMSNKTDDLGTEITTILEAIKNREGIELLSEIKNITGTESN